MTDLPAAHPDADTAPRPVPWNLPDAALIWILAFVGSGVIIMSLPATVSSQVAMPISVAAVGLTTLAYLRIRYGTSSLRQLMGTRRTTWRDVVAGAVHGGVAFIAFNLGLMGIVAEAVFRIRGELPQVQEGIQQAAQQALPLVFVSSAAILAPLAEEVFYRGVVMARLRDRFGPVIAIVTSSIIFTVVHAEPGNWDGTLLSFIGLFPLAIYLAVVFERRRNLVSIMVMHAVFNAIGVAAILANL